MLGIYLLGGIPRIYVLGGIPTHIAHDYITCDPIPLPGDRLSREGADELDRSSVEFVGSIISV